MGFITPYVINGAAHSAALFRRQAQRPASDQAGVSRPGDLRVSPLNVPADGFRVAVGGASIPSRYPGRERESYGVENADTEITVTGVVGTGSQATRRDAIIVEVLDPNYTAITHEDAAPLNYTQVRVVQNVATSARTIADIATLDGVTGYVLAFIEWPASTGTITASMISDARSLSRPQEKTVVRGINLSTTQTVTATSAFPSGGQTFPAEAEADGELDILIPDFAVEMTVLQSWNQVVYPGKGNAYGDMWLQIGSTNDPTNIKTDATRWSADDSTIADRGTVAHSVTLRVPENLRGRRVRFYPRANRVFPTGTGSNDKSIYADTKSGWQMTVVFREVAD